MNSISLTFKSKLNNDSESPACKRILSPCGNSTPMVEICSSLKSKMFTKVKEYKDAIRNAVTFGKMSMRSNKSRNPASKRLVPSTLLDVAFNVVAGNSEEGELLFNSTFSSPETEGMNASIGQIDDFNEMDDSLNFFFSTDDSLKSFLDHEKRTMEEFREEVDTKPATKKKIVSAKPLFFYPDELHQVSQISSTFNEFFDESSKSESSNAQDSDYENHVSM
ncbi:uncharacterized protein LOC144478795 [Augochlora pura]